MLWCGTPQSETASSPGLRFSDFVDDGHVEYVPVVSPSLGPPGPSKFRSSPIKRKTKISRSPVKFEISSPPFSPQKQLLVAYRSFPSALAAQASRGKSCRSGWDRVAAPVFQMGFR